MKNGVTWKAATVILVLAGAIMAGVWAVALANSLKSADNGERLSTIEATVKTEIPAIRSDIGEIKDGMAEQRADIKELLKASKD
jgi:hypothetical protein